MPVTKYPLERLEFDTPEALCAHLSPFFKRCRRALGADDRPLEVLCTLAMGKDRPGTLEGDEQGFARVQLGRAFPPLGFKGDDTFTRAIWRK